MLGKPVADFSLPSTGGSTFRLSEQRRKTLVLCFYPPSRHSLKTKFPFELLSDPEERACTQLGVMKDKNMYGKKVRGIERSTFVIDEKGKLAREWRGVKVPGHVEEVLSFVKAL
jgi:thioredoxin-dependent peroxiredoxin